MGLPGETRRQYRQKLPLERQHLQKVASGSPRPPTPANSPTAPTRNYFQDSPPADVKQAGFLAAGLVILLFLLIFLLLRSISLLY